MAIFTKKDFMYITPAAHNQDDGDKSTVYNRESSSKTHGQIIGCRNNGQVVLTAVWRVITVNWMYSWHNAANCTSFDKN